jgi:hypothetical protein
MYFIDLLGIVIYDNVVETILKLTKMNDSGIFLVAEISPVIFVDA